VRTPGEGLVQEPLESVRVVEVEGSHRGALVGRLLSGLGAEVTKVRVPTSTQEPLHVDAGAQAWSQLQEHLDEGKRIESLDWHGAAGRDRVLGLLSGADVLLEPEDDAGLGADAAVEHPSLIRCSVSAYGRTGPWSGRPGGDLTAQALSGVLSTTGFPTSEPVRGGVPAADYAAALFAAIGVVAALRQRRRTGRSAHVDVALLDTMLFFSNAFLSQAFAGQAPTRMGNRHTSLAPWNTYPTQDGSVVLCTSGDDHWAKCRALMGIDDSDGRLSSVTQRVADVGLVDALVSAWTSSLTTAEVVEACLRSGLPVGEVKTIPTVVQEARAHAGTAAPPSGPLTPLGRRVDATAAPAHRLTAGSGGGREVRGAQQVNGPLDGVRVLELAGYTAGPFCGRVLGGLGAQVVKIESPAGEPVRRWHPRMAGEGMFFRLNNLDKASLGIDVKHPRGKAVVERLVRDADVVLSNFAPGVMDRLGFSPTALRDANERIVSCFVSGFGSRGPSATRPAMDTVIQAESGVMSLTGRPGEPPVKFGISLADLMGSCAAALAIVSALEARERTGCGTHVDVSMHRSMMWLTETRWILEGAGAATDRLGRLGNAHPYFLGNDVVPALDGLLAVEVETEPQLLDLCSVIAPGQHVEALDGPARRRAVAQALRAWSGSRPAAAAAELLMEAGVPAAPVLEVPDAVRHPQVVARQVVGSAFVGAEPVPFVNTPLAGSFACPTASRFIGPVGSDAEDVLRELAGLDAAAVAELRSSGVIR